MKLQNIPIKFGPTLNLLEEEDFHDKSLLELLDLVQGFNADLVLELELTSLSGEKHGYFITGEPDFLMLESVLNDEGYMIHRNERSWECSISFKSDKFSVNCKIMLSLLAFCSEQTISAIKVSAIS